MSHQLHMSIANVICDIPTTLIHGFTNTLSFNAEEEYVATPSPPPAWIELHDGKTLRLKRGQKYAQED